MFSELNRSPYLPRELESADGSRALQGEQNGIERVEVLKPQTAARVGRLRSREEMMCFRGRRWRGGVSA